VVPALAGRAEQGAQGQQRESSAPETHWTQKEMSVAIRTALQGLATSAALTRFRRDQAKLTPVAGRNHTLANQREGLTAT
jgi:hypothetical protein